MYLYTYTWTKHVLCRQVGRGRGRRSCCKRPARRLPRSSAGRGPSARGRVGGGVGGATTGGGGGCKRAQQVYEQALVSLKLKASVDAEGGRTFAVIIEGGYMAKSIRPKQLEKHTVIRHFVMKCTTSARVDSFSIRMAN